MIDRACNIVYNKLNRWSISAAVFEKTFKKRFVLEVIRFRMNSERERLILEKILAEKRVSVKALAKALYISEPSIRRDLASLEAQNLIKRIHGGAMLEENALSFTKIPFAIRELEQHDAKVIMAQRAIELVRDNDVIFLDASSSAFNLISLLPLRKNITVITGGIKALCRLAEMNINTISTGGRLINSCLSLVGDDAYKIIEGYNADIAFFSCRGLSFDGKLTDISEPENNIRKKMIQNSKKSYLLCASDKIGKVYYHNLCHVNDISGVISEKDLPPEFNK